MVLKMQVFALDNAERPTGFPETLKIDCPTVQVGQQQLSLQDGKSIDGRVVLKAWVEEPGAFGIPKTVQVLRGGVPNHLLVREYFLD